jgi:excisionase family DNA binding protein
VPKTKFDDEIQPIAASIETATQLSGLGRTTIYQLINEGKIEARKAGDRTLVLTDSLRAYLRALPAYHPKIQAAKVGCRPSRKAARQIMSRLLVARGDQEIAAAAKGIDVASDDWPFAPLIPHRYRVILIDAPMWFSSGPNRNPRNHYPCLRDAELAALPIADLAHPDGARIFWWSTVPTLARSLALISGYGFKYSTMRVWLKTKRRFDAQIFTLETVALGNAYDIKNCIDILLIGKIGKPQRLGDIKPISIIWGNRREHSRKPDELPAGTREILQGATGRIVCPISGAWFRTVGQRGGQVHS